MNVVAAIGLIGGERRIKNLKLSEAMMLGAATCKMQAGNWNSCALGAAANAVGIPEVKKPVMGQPGNYDTSDRRWSIVDKWPWLDSKAWKNYENENEISVSMISTDRLIWERFDQLVCKGKMTFEQLVDYVRSIEPSCGVCNQYACTCSPRFYRNPESSKEVIPDAVVVLEDSGECCTSTKGNTL